MKSLAIAASTIAFAACATTGQGLPGREETSATVPRLELHATAMDEGQPAFPQRITEARLPGADRLSREIAFEPYGTVTTQVRLCIAPDGKVASVGLLAPSGMDAFDRAVVEGLAGWKYAAFPAPANTRVCENLTVAYRAP